MTTEEKILNYLERRQALLIAIKDSSEASEYIDGAISELCTIHLDLYKMITGRDYIKDKEAKEVKH